MGVTTAFRLLAGLVSFSIVARLLGPENFGVLMFWFSVAMLLALVTNYGLTPYVLREIGAHPDSAKHLIAEGLAGKLVLTVAVIVVAAGYLIGWKPESGLTFVLLLVAGVADSFSEFLNAGLRAAGRFDVETKVATVGAVANILIVSSLVFLFPSVDAAALAYGLARIFVLILTGWAVSKYFGRLRASSLKSGVGLVGRVSNYAIDFGFQSLFGQIDSVFLNYFVGPVGVGLHQAGMRVYQGGAQAATVLSNVFLPRSASMMQDGQAGFKAENTRIQLVFIAIGFVFGGIVSLLAKPIVLILFGSSYIALASLLSLFGILFFVRMFASAWGVVLTAAGMQSFRAWVGFFHWVAVSGLAVVLVPVYGNRGWLFVLIFSSLLMGTAYASRAASLVSRPASVFVITGGGLAILVLLCFSLVSV